MIKNKEIKKMVDDLRDMGIRCLTMDNYIVMDCPYFSINKRIVEYAKENNLIDSLEYRYAFEYTKKNAEHLHTVSDFRDYNEHVELAVFDLRKEVI